MANDFRSYNIIYVIYDRKNESNCSLLITHYSLLVTDYSEYKHPIRATMHGYFNYYGYIGYYGYMSHKIASNLKNNIHQ